jgi:hypothetical protein
MVAILAFSIALMVCYNFNQSREIESWRDSALLTEKIDSKTFIRDEGPYQCNCKCQLKCPPKISTHTAASKAGINKKKKGRRINYYPWYVYNY